MAVKNALTGNTLKQLMMQLWKKTYLRMLKTKSVGTTYIQHLAEDVLLLSRSLSFLSFESPQTNNTVLKYLR